MPAAAAISQYTDRFISVLLRLRPAFAIPFATNVDYSGFRQYPSDAAITLAEYGRAESWTASKQ